MAIFLKGQTGAHKRPLHQGPWKASYASGSHSADWLNAMPVEACGLVLDNEAVRIAVGLRLGLSLCGPYRCQCGEMVGEKCYHGFVCRRSQGRSLRHHAVNDILWRALIKAEIPPDSSEQNLMAKDRMGLR